MAYSLEYATQQYMSPCLFSAAAYNTWLGSAISKLFGFHMVKCPLPTCLFFFSRDTCRIVGSIFFWVSQYHLPQKILFTDDDIPVPIHGIKVHSSVRFPVIISESFQLEMTTNNSFSIKYIITCAHRLFICWIWLDERC